MPESPRFIRIVLSRFRQFGFCDIDLAHPITGEPLDKICLLGPNGVGKSTVLDQLYGALAPVTESMEAETGALVLVGLEIEGEPVFRATDGGCGDRASWFRGDIVETEQWRRLANDPPGLAEFTHLFSDHELRVLPGYDSGRLALYTPECDLVDGEPVGGFRDFLAQKDSERQDQYHQYLKRPENRDRTIAEVEGEFSETHPDPIAAIHELWRPVLEATHLRFQPDEADPLVSERTGNSVDFSALSPGLRRHLLRVARVHDTFESAGAGFLFLDDPEAGLTPDLARSQIEYFGELFGGVAGQIVATTHSPRVVSLFSPEERITLRFDRSKGVTVSERHTTNLDTPTHPSEEVIETKPEPSKARKTDPARLAKLRRAIEDSDDQDELADLIDEMMSLRNGR